MPGRMLSPCMVHWISFTEKCWSTECIHCEGPLCKRYAIGWTSLNCVIVTIRSSSSFPPSLVSLVDKGSFRSPVQLCVFDCGKIFGLSVRVPRSLDWLFPWGSPSSEGEAEPYHCSETLLLPATPSGSSNSRIPLPCLVWAVRVTSPLP